MGRGERREETIEEKESEFIIEWSILVICAYVT